jgi:DNA-binding transcriptional LysR family regulator
VPAAIAALAAQRPGVEVRLREGSSMAHLGRVARGALDLAVVGPAEAPDGVTLEPLLDDPLLVAVGRAHPLALIAGAAELDALRDEPWIAAHTDVSATLLAGVRWVPRIAYAVADWNAKLGLVAAGLGITLVPGLAARGVRDDVTLVPLRGCTRPVFLAQPAGAPASPQAQALADELRAAAR